MNSIKQMQPLPEAFPLLQNHQELEKAFVLHLNYCLQALGGKGKLDLRRKWLVKEPKT